MPSIAKNIRNLLGNAEYLNEVHPMIWLMNNHRWAFYVWEQARLSKKIKRGNTLVHIDYHWDGINDLQDEDGQPTEIAVDNLDDLDSIMTDGKRIRFDSFIAPSVLVGTISSIHFFCLQQDTEIGIDEHVLRKSNAKQTIHSSINSLVNECSNEEILLDLDIDIFNKSEFINGTQLWPKDEMINFLDTIRPLFLNFTILTIVASPGYSGDKEAVSYLLRLLFDRMQDWGVLRRQE
jgi:hypothetical protein